MSTRLSWDQYFMRIALLVAERATCNRAKIGAVIVKDKNIIATGYNGSPAGQPHCTDVGCLLYVSRNPDGEEEENCFRTIHAEINAIAQAAKHGVEINDAYIYITASPCYHCLKTLMNTGIKRIYYLKPYKIDRIRPLLENSDIELLQVELDRKEAVLP
jgi:dCMP deaminase